MKNTIIHFLTGLLVLTSLSACSQRKNKTAYQTMSIKQVNDTLAKANQTFLSTEKERIQGYIKRRDLPMKQTGSGLWYCFLKRNNSGELAKAEQRAWLNFKVSLLDGTVCYTSDSTGTQNFKIDHDNVESGLHEAVKLMKVGEKAKVIIPSYLAHGLLGDLNKIPPRSAIVYDLELVKLTGK